MTSKTSRATASANQGSSQTVQPTDGLLFPIAPETHEPVSNKTATDEQLAARKPEREELLLPSHDEAKELCNLAAQIKTLAPWQWMQETDMFGVEDPETRQIGFVSVMGHIGEYEAVGVYSGAAGLFGFIDLQSGESPNPDRLIEIPQIQVSFSAAKFLEKRDRALLKSAGVKFTGAKPMFRSYRPGFLPWFITLREARLLIDALTQTLEMSKRFAEQPAIFPSEGDGKTESFLVRVPHQQDTELVWEDQIKRIKRPPLPPIETSIDARLLSHLRNIHLKAMELEADLFIGPAGIGEPNERPLALYMLILVDRQSGIILGFEALTAEDSLNTMHATVTQKVANLLWQAKVLPKQIIIRSALLCDLLEPLEKEFKIQLRRAHDLPALDEAAASITQFLHTGKM